MRNEKITPLYERLSRDDESVSYTHLDVYKRQAPNWPYGTQQAAISMQIWQIQRRCLSPNGNMNTPTSKSREIPTTPNWKLPAPRLPSFRRYASALILHWKPSSRSRHRTTPSGRNRSDKEKDGQADLPVRPLFPVSYTHLDVYKRQPMTNIIAGITKDLKAVPKKLKEKAKSADVKKLIHFILFK